VWNPLPSIQTAIPGAATIALHASFMRLTLLALLLGGCTGVSFAPSIGFNGSWYGPGKITFTSDDYEINGRPGHFGSDANTIYFTPTSLPPGASQQPTISCLYTLEGDTLILRDCPYAGEYRR
jgi:hypothetical protein